MNNKSYISKRLSYNTGFAVHNPLYFKTIDKVYSKFDLIRVALHINW